MQTNRILLVDDEPRVTDALVRSLRGETFEVVAADSGPRALELLRSEPFQVVVSDERMPGMSGSQLLSVVRREHPGVMRIILTGQASVDSAIRAINEGEVYRFLTKPCDGRELAVAIRQALQQRELVLRSQRLLGEYRRQSALLEQLERDNPGLTRVERDANGAILVEEFRGDVDRLLEELEREVGEGAEPTRA